MLAALQFNENGMREQATTKEGKKDMPRRVSQV